MPTLQSKKNSITKKSEQGKPPKRHTFANFSKGKSISFIQFEYEIVAMTSFIF